MFLQLVFWGGGVLTTRSKITCNEHYRSQHGETAALVVQEIKHKVAKMQI